MKGSPKVIERLNQALSLELGAVNQYWLHYRLTEDWGLGKLAAKERAESIEEMHHADKLVQRIIFLEGHPNLQTIAPLRIGTTVKEVLEADLAGEYEAQKTYAENFADDHDIAGDITQIDADEIPDHDVLLAGFPCQPFSLAGVSKKNALGKPHGFECATQGTLFFHLCEIIDRKQPPTLLLENVKNLKSHDRGRTWSTIEGTLQELGYEVFRGGGDSRNAELLGRSSSDEVVLVPRLRSALQRLNPALPPEAIEQAVEELTKDRRLTTPAQANQEVARQFPHRT